MSNSPEGQEAAMRETITDADPASIEAAILQARTGRNISSVRIPSSAEIADWLHRASSRRKGGLPRDLRRVEKGARKS